MSETGGFLKGFFVGGLIGAGLALLYAPKSGRELRGDIRDKSRGLYDKGREKAVKLYGEAEGLVEDVKEQARHFTREAKKNSSAAQTKSD